jgi:hypothetical protein
VEEQEKVDEEAKMHTRRKREKIFAIRSENHFPRNMNFKSRLRCAKNGRLALFLMQNGGFLFGLFWEKGLTTIFLNFVLRLLVSGAPTEKTDTGKKRENSN